MKRKFAFFVLSLLAVQSLCFHSQAAADESVYVIFLTHQMLQFKQVMKIVGGGDELYNWNITAGPAMTWNEGNKWVWVASLTKGKTYEYKAVVVNDDTGKCNCWMAGANRELTVPSDFNGEYFLEEFPWNNISNDCGSDGSACAEKDGCTYGADCGAKMLRIHPIV